MLELAAVNTRSIANIWRSVPSVMFALGDRDRAGDAGDRQRARRQRGDVQRDPRARLERVGGFGERADDHERHAHGQRELREVEGELDRRQPAERVGGAGAQQRAEQESVAARERQPEDEREVRQRERVRAAAEMQMHHARLGDRPADRDRPPRKMRVGERLGAVQESEEQRDRERRERRAVEHDSAHRGQPRTAPARAGVVS